jgi:hypothetical protein
MEVIMKLIYKGIDITNKVNILQSDIYDKAGGEADRIELYLSDTEKLWREWGPEKDDVLEVKQDGFTSGTMYNYFIQTGSGVFTIKSRSTPPKAKTPKDKSWENVRFKSIASDIAGNYQFALETYGISDWLYDCVDQIYEPDFKFLHDRCVIESCTLKIHDEKVIMYSEPYMEALATVLTLTPEDLIGKPSLTTVSEGLFSACCINYLNNSNQLLSFTYAPDTAPDGPVMKPKIRAANYGEAERFTKGCLRAANKWETFGSVKIKLNLSIAAGNTIKLSGFGSFSGKYFVDECNQKMLGGTTGLKIRKVLEGY